MERFNPESPENRDAGRRKIAIDLTPEQISNLKPGDRLKFNIIGADQEQHPKEIEIIQVNEVGEFYSIEGTTRTTAPGKGGSLVTLEINPHDSQANEIIF